MRENEMKREKDMSQMRGSQVKWKWVWVNESDQGNDELSNMG